MHRFISFLPLVNEFSHLLLSRGACGHLSYTLDSEWMNFTKLCKCHVPEADKSETWDLSVQLEWLTPSTEMFCFYVGLSLWGQFSDCGGQKRLLAKCWVEAFSAQPHLTYDFCLQHSFKKYLWNHPSIKEWAPKSPESTACLSKNAVEFLSNALGFRQNPWLCMKLFLFYFSHVTPGISTLPGRRVKTHFWPCNCILTLS